MKIVVVGTGSIGLRHLAALDRVPGITPIAAPIRPGRIAELARDERLAMSIDDAIAATPAGVIIATDTARHIADTRAFLGPARGLLVEKPLAEASASVASLSGARTDQIFTAFCLRFHPGLRRFRELQERVGAMHHVRIECQSYLPDWRPGTDHRRAYSARKGEGGVLRDLAHEIDYACWLFGRPTAVTAQLTPGSALEIEADAGADLQWQAPSGATVSLRLDYLTRSSRRRMTAFGDRGELEWDAIAGTVAFRPPGAAEEVEQIAIERDTMMLAQAEAFVATLHGQAGGDLATFDDGAFAVALTDAAIASSASHARVVIEVPTP